MAYRWARSFDPGLSGNAALYQANTVLVDDTGATVAGITPSVHQAPAGTGYGLVIPDMPDGRTGFVYVTDGAGNSIDSWPVSPQHDENADTKTSTRNSVVPDNTSVAAIKAKTDLIPAAGPPDAAHYTNARGDKLDDLDAPVSGAVTVGAYGTGLDPASQVLVTPGHKLNTDAAGDVAISSVTTALAQALADAIISRDFTAIAGVIPRYCLLNGIRPSVAGFYLDKATGLLHVLKEDGTTVFTMAAGQDGSSLPITSLNH